jgi:hypothetical protein
MVQFFVDLDWKKKSTILMSTAAALLLFPILFHGSVKPAYATGDVMPPTFGQGPINVRPYTDYFCKLCRAMEPKVEPVLTELVKKNIITLTFIDTPFYQHSSLYSRYFLYSTQEKKGFDLALAVRNVLITAATENIINAAKLEERLKEKDIPFKEFEVKSIFAFFAAQLQGDKVEATPSCLIEQNGKKELFEGSGDIRKALEKLLK